MRPRSFILSPHDVHAPGFYAQVVRLIDHQQRALLLSLYQFFFGAANAPSPRSIRILIWLLITMETVGAFGAFQSALKHTILFCYTCMHKTRGCCYHFFFQYLHKPTNCSGKWTREDPFLNNTATKVQSLCEKKPALSQYISTAPLPKLPIVPHPAIPEGGTLHFPQMSPSPRPTASSFLQSQ